MSHITLGEFLRQYRKLMGLTQKQFGKQLGFDHTLISKVETGREKPRRELIEMVVHAFGLSEAEQREIWGLYQEVMAEVAEIPVALTYRSDWGEAPDVSGFYGREAELGTLTQWMLHDRCRLVAILGLGGIGKTALVTKLAKLNQYHFSIVIWRSLLNAPPIAELLDTCLSILSNQQAMNLQEERVDQKISRLIDHLRHSRALLILDNVETILRGGESAGYYREGYEQYGQLIRRVEESEHQSCLLLTSREKPDEIGRLSGTSSPVREYLLRGLMAQSGQQILADKGLVGEPSSWQRLLERYSGNRSP